jgi:hypothetical protein
LIQADMLAEEPTRRYDGLVARDSVFHLPDAAHGGLLRKMHGWFEPRPHAAVAWRQ